VGRDGKGKGSMGREEGKGEGKSRREETVGKVCQCVAAAIQASRSE